MTEKPDRDPKKQPRRALRAVAGLLVFFALAGFGFWQLLVHPASPLPPEWNPTKPLVVAEPLSWVTPGKLRRALRDPAVCLAALPAGAQITRLEPLEINEQCHVRNRVVIAGLGDARVRPLQTSCAIALRAAMWERHALQPAAERHLNTRVTSISQIGSYNCRPIRTPDGPSTRMSTHATAEAIDITGFEFADGRRATLQDHWGSVTFGAFLEAARDGACRWFATTLGPEYNALHADHFHLQSRGWGTCR